MTHEPSAADRRRADRAAADIAAFAVLFEARRAAEAAGSARDATNARRMDVLAHGVQRSLEHVGLAWLEDAGDARRPDSIVALLAYGDARDVEPLAGRALAQLREAERRYRAGEVEPTLGGPSQRRRIRGRDRRSWRWLRLGAVLIAVITIAAVALSAIGSWGVTEEPQPLTTTLTRSERAF